MHTLIHKEFQVFSKELMSNATEDHRQLEQALKILKVLNFLCKNTNLISSQGIKFLIN